MKIQLKIRFQALSSTIKRFFETAPPVCFQIKNHNNLG